MPQGILKVFHAVNHLPFNPGNKISFKKDLWPMFFASQNETEPFLLKDVTAVKYYHFLGYLLPAIVVKISELCHLPHYLILIAARCANLALYSTVIYYAVKIVPFGKWIFACLTLLPMSLFLGASLSYDAYSIALSFLVVALFLHWALEGTVVDSAFLKKYCFISFLLSTIKPAYAFLIGLYLIIPARSARSNKDYFLYFFTGIVILFVSEMAWVTQVWKIPGHLDGINSHGQLMWIVSHPISFIAVLIKSIFRGHLIKEFVGVLGWLDTQLSLPVYITSLTILLLATVFSGGSRMSLMQNLILVMVGMAITGVICILVYISWNPVGNPRLAGLQGRYFIPCVLLFLLAVNRYNLGYREGYAFLPLAWTMGIFFVDSLTVVNLLQRYYVLN